MSPDDQAILLLCSRLAGPTGRETAGPSSYTLAEWNALARRLSAAGLRPGNLLELDFATFAERAQVPPSEAERVARLLESGGQLAIELERLASLGIRVVTRASTRYPSRLRSKLRDSAPPVLYYSGELALAEARALAVVGSRDVDEAGTEFAEWLAGRAAREGIAVVSGGARGVDAVAMGGALEAGGTVIGFPADSLERMIRSVDARHAIAEERLLLITPFNPRAGFSIGNAMARNKLIYAQADWAVVVAAEVETGGTWGGAMECLRSGWTPVFVRSGEAVPAGNRELIRRGARPFPSAEVAAEEGRPLAEALEAATAEREERQPNLQPDLFATGTASGGERGEVAPIPSAPAETAPRATDAPWSAEWESFLEQPRDEAEIAERFGLSRSQVKARLKALIDSGRVRRTTRPAVRYQTVPMKL